MQKEFEWHTMAGGQRWGCPGAAQVRGGWRRASAPPATPGAPAAPPPGANRPEWAPLPCSSAFRFDKERRPPGWARTADGGRPPGAQPARSDARGVTAAVAAANSRTGGTASREGKVSKCAEEAYEVALFRHVKIADRRSRGGDDPGGQVCALTTIVWYNVVYK